MSLKQMQEDIALLKRNMQDEEVRRYKKKEWKLPFGIRAKTKKAVKQGGVLCVFLRNNKTLEFKIAKVVGGMFEIDKYQFSAYENDAVYHYKKLPVAVIFEWRLLPIGGRAEEYRARLVGDERDEALAESLKITQHAQQTIIRKIELAELSKEQPKKGGMSWVWWIAIAGLAIYLLSQFFGGGGA